MCGLSVCPEFLAANLDRLLAKTGLHAFAYLAPDDLMWCEEGYYYFHSRVISVTFA